MIVLLSLLVSVAQAHRPHSIVIDIASRGDGTMWLIEDPHDISQLLRSTDRGAHWDYVGGDPQEQDLAGLDYLGDTLVAVGVSGTVWSTADDGTTWSSALLPAGGVRRVAGSDDRLGIATGTGVFVGSLASLPTASALVPTVAFRDVGFDPDDSLTVVAVADDGRVLFSDDGGATDEFLRPIPGGRTGLSAAAQGGTVYVGTDNGMLSFDGADWSVCGALPIDPRLSQARNIARVVTLSDGTVLAATGAQGVFVSHDRCESFSLQDTGFEIVYGGIGYATDAREGYTALIAEGATWVAGGFDGVARSADEGATWNHPVLIPTDYSRGLAFAPTWPDDPRVWMGGYGGAVSWTDDGGRSWSGSAVGVGSSVYAYGLTPNEDIATTGLAWYSGSDKPFMSTDNGATWTQFVLPMPRVRSFFSHGGRVIAIGEDETGGIKGEVAYTDDAGGSWDQWSGLQELMRSAGPNDVQTVTYDGSPWILVLTDLPVGLIGSADDGASFTRLYTGEAGTAAGIAAWPVGDATRLVVAGYLDGVVLSDDAGKSWRPAAAPPTGIPRLMREADDGTILLITAGGQVWRSEDGGDHFAAVGEPIAPASQVIALAPDFAKYGTAIISTQTGGYFTTDRGDSWHVLSRYERMEDLSYHLECATSTGEDCAAYTDDSAGCGGGFLLADGDTVGFSFQGDHFAVVGPLAGSGSLSVTVSGVAAGTLSADGSDLALGGLGTGWKDVVLTATGVGADGLRIDRVDAWDGGAFLPIPGSGDTGGGDTGDTGTHDTGAHDTGTHDTGTHDTAGDSGGADDTGTSPPKKCGSCGKGGSSALVLPPMFLFLLLRRRREDEDEAALR